MVDSIRSQKPVPVSENTVRQVVENNKNLAGWGSKAVNYIDPNATRSAATLSLVGITEAPIVVDRMLAGVKMIKTAKEDRDGAGVLFGGFEVTRGAVSSVQVAVNVASASSRIADTVAKVATVATATLGQAASGMGMISSLVKVVPFFIKIDQGRRLKKMLKNGPLGLSAIFNDKTLNHDLKRVAPKVYARLEKGEKVTQNLVDLAIKEINTTITWLSLGSAAFLAAITATAIALAVTGAGAAAVAAATIIGLVVAVLGTGVDFASMIKDLKESTYLSKKDLAFKIIAIVVGVVVLGVSVAFAPSTIIAIVSGVVGVVMLASPIGGIIYLKLKEKRLAEAAKKKRLAEEKLEKDRLVAEANAGIVNTVMGWFGIKSHPVFSN